MRATCYLILFFLLVACKKDTPLLPEPEVITVIKEVEPCNMPDTCFPITHGCSSYTYSPICKFGKICFNPINNDEFVWFKFYDSSNACITSYNLTSNKTLTLTSDVRAFDAAPFWSDNGYIYFNGMDKNIKRIKPLNSTVELVDLKAGDMHPLIKNELIYTTQPNLDKPGKHFLNKPNQPFHLDSVYSNALSTAAALSNNGILAFADSSTRGFEISILSYTNERKLEQLTKFYDKNHFEPVVVRDIKWHPGNEQIFFVKGYELYSLNIKTKKLKLIKRTCGIGRITNFSISPNGKKIVACYQSIKSIYDVSYTSCVYQYFFYLGLMDINGCDEKIFYKED